MLTKKNQGKINFRNVGANFCLEFTSSDIFAYYSVLSTSRKLIFEGAISLSFIFFSFVPSFFRHLYLCFKAELILYLVL